MPRDFLTDAERFDLYMVQMRLEHGAPQSLEYLVALDEAGLKVPGANWPKPREE